MIYEDMFFFFQDCSFTLTDTHRDTTCLKCTAQERGGGKKHNNKHTPRFRVIISTRQGSTDTSQEAKSAKKLFHTSHLTSHPLQNYPPQPQGRDCWKRNYLVESLLLTSAVNVQDGFVCLFV